MNPCFYNGAINRSYPIQRLSDFAGDYLHDPLERMLLITRIDPLWRVAELEIFSLFEAGGLCQHRTANLLRDAEIDGRFVYHHRALAQVLSDRLRGSDEGR